MGNGGSLDKKGVGREMYRRWENRGRVKGDSQGGGNREKVGKLCNMVEYLAVIKSQRWEPEIKGYGKLDV